MRDWMKQARKENGLTQLQVAKELNVSEGYYSYIESGARRQNLDIDLALKLSSIFNIPVQQIIEYEATPA